MVFKALKAADEQLAKRPWLIYLTAFTIVCLVSLAIFMWTADDSAGAAFFALLAFNLYQQRRITELKLEIKALKKTT